MSRLAIAFGILWMVSQALFPAVMSRAIGSAAAVLVQTVFTWFARRASFVMGESIFGELREEFMDRVVAPPLSTVERAGTGDLVSRTTNDVEALSQVIRLGIPSIFVGAVTRRITVAAAFVTGWVVARVRRRGRPDHEIGAHDEPITAGGAYAALWLSWRDDPQPAPR